MRKGALRRASQTGEADDLGAKPERDRSREAACTGSEVENDEPRGCGKVFRDLVQPQLDRLRREASTIAAPMYDMPTSHQLDFLAGLKTSVQDA